MTTKCRLCVAIVFGFLALTALAAERYAFQVEKNHSTVAFTIPIAGGLTKVTGKFTDFTADIVWDSEDAAKSSVTATIQATSMNTGIEARDKDLRGPVFFDAATFPQLTYVSRKIEKRGDHFVVEGDLTMKGVTKPVVLTVVITGVDRGEKGDQAPILGISATGKLNRLDFGIANDWKHTVIPNFLGNEIAIQIDLWTRGGKRLEKTP